MISRKRIFEVIEKSKKNDIKSLIFDWFIIILIMSNVVAVILESFQSIAKKYSSELFIFEVVSVVFFTIEILLRIITCDYKFPEKSKFKSFIKYNVSFMAIIDLLAVIPFYLPYFFVIDLRSLRILRLTRMIRILKVQRYNKSLMLIGEVFRRKKYDLLLTLFITFLLLLLSSSIMFYIETRAQPDKFPNIIAAFWWSVATLTTVGYGDVYPVTIIGKILSGIIALLGIGVVALPTGIISSGFTEIIESKRKSKENNEITYCSYCGKRLK